MNSFFLIFAIISIIIFLITIIVPIVLPILLNKKKKVLNSFLSLFVGVFLCGLLLHIPLYLHQLTILESSSESIFTELNINFLNITKSILFSFHNTIRLFVLDGDFSFLFYATPYLDEPIRSIYEIFSAIIFIICPFFTFAAIVTIIVEINSQLKLFFTTKRKLFIFSDLNQKSISLAEKLINQKSDIKIVFTSFIEDGTNSSAELLTKAKEIGAIIFKKSLQSIKIDYFLFRTVKEINIYFISDDDNANWITAETINNKYLNKKKDRIHLFIVSSNINGEARVGSFKVGNVTFRRLDICRNSIYGFLIDNGNVIFDYAINSETTNKKIHALIYGFNSFAQMMTRSLCWFCQMDGYDVIIDVYEEDDKKIKAFKSLYSELVGKGNNLFSSMGENRYSLNFYSSENFGCESKEELSELISKNGEITFAFVDCDNDDLTLNQSINLRMIFERNFWKPYILCSVDKSDLIFKENVNIIIGESKFCYEINFLGKTECLDRTDEFENMSLEKHLAWGEKGNFSINEYGFLSSLASSIHKKYKVYCGMLPKEYLTDNKETKELIWSSFTFDQKEVIKKCEHRRWNAYMRSEGYVYSPKRNKLARTHCDLVDYSELSQEEKNKDQPY